MAKVQVRVTMFADPIEVDEEEVPHLRSQGLLVEDTGQEPGAGSDDSGQAAAGQSSRSRRNAPVNGE